MLFIVFGEVYYEFAGKLAAFIAELNLVIQNLFAFFLNESTFLVSGTTTSAVRKLDSFSFSIVL